MKAASPDNFPLLRLDGIVEDRPAEHPSSPFDAMRSADGMFQGIQDFAGCHSLFSNVLVASDALRNRCKGLSVCSAAPGAGEFCRSMVLNDIADVRRTVEECYEF